MPLPLAGTHPRGVRCRLAAVADGLADRGDDRLAHFGGLPETHLALGRMDVHVNLFRRQADEKQHHRTALFVQRRISLAQRIGDHRGRGRTLVDEDILLAAFVARHVRQARETSHLDPAAAQADRPQAGAELFAEKVAHTLFQRGARRQTVQLAPVGGQAQADLRTRQRLQGEDRPDVRLLGLVGAQELAPRRHVEKKVANLDRGAGRHTRLARLLQRAAQHGQLGAGLVSRPAGLEGEARDRGDRGQRLAAEPQRVDALDVVHVAQLAGGLALDAQQGVVAPHAAAVVADRDQLAPARRDRDVDAPRSRVDRVLDQLFDHRGRTLDHLARRDLVGHVRRQQPDMPVSHHAQQNARFRRGASSRNWKQRSSLVGMDRDVSHKGTKNTKVFWGAGTGAWTGGKEPRMNANER